MTTVRGTVINIHHHGATVRLEDGTLATIPAPELAANRPAYASSLAKRRALDFRVTGFERHRVAGLASSDRGETDEAVAVPASFSNDAFEARMGAYLKSTEEWAPADQVPPAERHFIRKKRRARLFEARVEPT